MIKAITKPTKFMAGYSAVPLRVNDDDSLTSNSYKYITNIVWDLTSVDSILPYPISGIVYTRCVCSDVHKFKVGDNIIINDTMNGNTLTGYYNVLAVPSLNTFVISNQYESGITNPMEALRVIKYKMPPSVEGDAKLDLSNTLKDFVTENLEDVNDIFDGKDTRFGFALANGLESAYSLTFVKGAIDIPTTNGYSIYFPALSNPNQVKFMVGDVIVIQQSMFEWAYTDNFFSSGNLSFTGTTAAPVFSPNGTVTVTGQITAPHYNGLSTVVDSGSNYITVDKPFDTSTPAEGGIIYCINTPEYNSTATIVSIKYVAGYGLVIETSMPAQGIPSAGGIIGFADRRIIEQPITLDNGDINVYNARLENREYDINGFDKYVIQYRLSSFNNISTILKTQQRYNIEKSTKSWLLVHYYNKNQILPTPRYKFYNAAGAVISEYTLNTNYNETNPRYEVSSIFTNASYTRIATTNGVGSPSSGRAFQIGDKVAIHGTSLGTIYATVTLRVSSTQLEIAPSFPLGTLTMLGGEYITLLNPTEYYDYYTPVGIDQLMASTNKVLVSGVSLPTVMNQVVRYDVSIYGIKGDGEITEQLTNPINYKLTDDCTGYDLMHLMWKDSLGSWLSMAFKYKSRANLEVDRKKYYKTEGNWDNNTFDFDSFGRGDKDYYVRARESMSVNSGWLDEFEVTLIRDLFQSASVYLQQPNGELIACSIDEREIQLIKSSNSDLIQYGFNVTFASNNYRF